MADEVNGVLYNESDADIPRNRGARLVLFLASIAATTLIPGIIGSWIIGMIPLSGMGTLGFIAGMIAGQYAFAGWVPNFFVVVPQAQAFVTLNDLRALVGKGGNPNNTFGPGISLEWPWVSRGKRSNLSLQTITIPFEEKVPGKDTQLLVRGSYQLKVNILNASKFVGTDESTIRGGAIDLILAGISQDLANQSADEAKGSIESINRKLGKKFGVGEHHHQERAGEIEKFEDRYGISSVAVTISSIDLPPDVQKTRDAVDEANQAIRSVSAMFGLEPDDLKQKLRTGELTTEQYMEMLDRTLAQGGASTMNIQAHKFGGLESLARAIVEVVRR